MRDGWYRDKDGRTVQVVTTATGVTVRYPDGTTKVVGR